MATLSLDCRAEGGMRSGRWTHVRMTWNRLAAGAHLDQRFCASTRLESFLRSASPNGRVHFCAYSLTSMEQHHSRLSWNGSFPLHASSSNLRSDGTRRRETPWGAPWAHVWTTESTRKQSKPALERPTIPLSQPSYFPPMPVEPLLYQARYPGSR
jgi:hypothetical protein